MADRLDLANQVTHPYSEPAPLVAPRAAAPPSQIPTDRLSNQADRWLSSTSPAPASVTSSNNASPSQSPPVQYQQQQQFAPNQHRPMQAQQPMQQAYQPLPSQFGYPVSNSYQQPPGPPPPPPPPPPQQGQYGQPSYYNQAPQFSAPPVPTNYQTAYPSVQPPQFGNPPPQPYYAGPLPQQGYQQLNPQYQQQWQSGSTLSLEQMSISAPPSATSTPRSPRPSYYSSPEEGPPHKLSVTYPDQKMLAAMRNAACIGGGDIFKQVAWAKQVLKYVERHQSGAGDSSRINDPTLVRWTDEALGYILKSSSSPNPVPLALYLRGDLSASGSFPSYRAKEPKLSFRDFEAAANAGYEKAWFRIGRAYEDFGDVRRAVGAYERGVEKGDCGSTYRLSMAYLLGQIGVSPDPKKAIALLQRAADTADLDTPQPPYILGMLLAGEFESPAVQLPSDLVPRNIEEAKWRIERSAYLSFGPAQYKMGFSYEYAALNCLFEPLLSVQYYALASQNGEVEADMALSKWYLCGSEGYFDKDESLAFTFAEKAASRQLPTAMFALAYFFEVGINGRKDVDAAKRWYTRAASNGNTDARDRLDALSTSEANTLSRDEHDAQIGQKLVRKRTQAEARSNVERERLASLNLAASLGGGLPPKSNSSGPAPAGQRNGSARPAQAWQDTEGYRLRRRNTRTEVEAAAGIGKGRLTPLAVPSASTPPQRVSPMGPRPMAQGYAAQTPSRQSPMTGSAQQAPGSTAPPQEISMARTAPPGTGSFAEMGIPTQPAKKGECLMM